MESLTINLCYGSDEQELKSANVDKLKLALCLCKIKMEKDIELPFDYIKIIGVDYIKDEYPDLINLIGKLVSHSRRLGVAFLVYEKEEQKKQDFKF